MRKVNWILVSCACLCFSCVAANPSPNSAESVFSYRGFRASRGSKSRSSKVPGIEDFSDYYTSFNHGSIIYYWKDADGKYMCIMTGSGNIIQSLQYFQELQNNHACPASLMCEILDKKCEETGWYDLENLVYEISPSMGELEFDDLSSWYHGAPSRNQEIYSLLRLEKTYERYYSGSKYVYFKHDGLFKNERNPAFRILPKHFTNLSHIYRWVAEGGEYRYAVMPERDGKLGSYQHLRYVQDYISFNAAEMRRVVEAYYSITDVAMGNLIVDVPLVYSPNEAAKEILDKYPDNVSHDASVYSELGLYESYRINFGN